VADELAGRVRFRHVNTDENPELAQQFRIQGIPTLVRLVRGQEQGRLIGFRPADQVRAFALGEHS
jgi:thioredoxin-like negative regulator of GroEL